MSCSSRACSDDQESSCRNPNFKDPSHIEHVEHQHLEDEELEPDGNEAWDYGLSELVFDEGNASGTVPELTEIKLEDYRLLLESGFSEEELYQIDGLKIKPSPVAPVELDLNEEAPVDKPEESNACDKFVSSLINGFEGNDDGNRIRWREIRELVGGMFLPAIGLSTMLGHLSETVWDKGKLNSKGKKLVVRRWSTSKRILKKLVVRRKRVWKKKAAKCVSGTTSTSSEQVHLD